MLEKHINSTFYFIIGLCTTILGFTSIFIGRNILQWILLLAGLLLGFNGLFKIANYIFKKEKKDHLISIILKGFLDIITAFVIEYNIDLVTNSLTILMGLYILFNALIHLITYLIYIKYNIRGRLLSFVQFMIYTMIAFLLILHPETNVKYAQLIVGVYLIFYGISNLNNFLIEIIPREKTDALKTLIKIPLPLFITAFIPQRLINLINELLKTNTNHENLSLKKEEGKPDLEVIIHLAESGTAAFGHMEICFNGKIYSYGNYDRHSRKLFNMIGDGVLLIADRNQYIKYNVTKLNRYLVCFGMALTKKQKSDIQKRITYLISSNTEDWYPDQQRSDLGQIPEEEFHDISSDIYRYANGKFKKIVKGKNKKFFVLKTNCAIIVDYILGSISSNLLNINGLIAPGTYYEYLNTEFLRKNSAVITRKVYTIKDFEEEQ